MKLDQIAYYAHNEQQVAEIKKQFGLEGCVWVEDEVVGEVFGAGGSIKGKSRAHLRFNYDLGIEFEILTYLEGWHWHIDKAEFLDGLPFISHIGFHMQPMQTIPLQAKEAHVQTMYTLSHTNPYLLERGRKYHYEIYRGNSLNGKAFAGVDRKYIWRIEHDKG